MKDVRNIDSLNISFSAEYSKGTYSDVDIKIFAQNEKNLNPKKKYLNATILYSKSYYEGKSQKEIIKEI